MSYTWEPGIQKTIYTYTQIKYQKRNVNSTLDTLEYPDVPLVPLLEYRIKVLYITVVWCSLVNKTTVYT